MTEADICLPAKPDEDLVIELVTGLCDKSDLPQDQLIAYVQQTYYSDLPDGITITVISVIINHSRCIEERKRLTKFETQLFDAIIITETEYDSEDDWETYINDTDKEVYDTDDEEFDILIDNYDLDDLIPHEPDVECKNNEEFDACYDGQCFDNCESVYLGESAACDQNSTCPGPGGCTCEAGKYRVRGAFSRCVTVEKCPHYDCTQLAGYAYDYNLHACLDINECDAADACGAGNCVNKPGSFECICDEGYEIVNGECVDINECQLLSRDVQCDENTDCFNTDGSFYCDCAEGFNWPEDGPCANENECRLGTHNCGVNSFCVDLPGTFVCVCNAGYTDINGVCVDINECSTDTNDCDARNGNCENTDGGFICTCSAGFAFDNVGNCVNIDECAVGIDSCDPISETCYDQSGSHYCECKNGFDDNGHGKCTDVNECDLADLDVCGENTVCVNNLGGYICQCLPGFTLLVNRFTQDVCIDINECELGLENCKHLASCVNTQGSYTCECEPGYAGDANNCLDVNECDDDIEHCGRNAQCTNTVGSFTCDCLAGFTDPNGNGCGDVDECADPANTNCAYDSGAVCNNIDGGYECMCPSGMDGEGTLNDPCAESFECNDPNEQIDGCANQLCFATCYTFLNNKPDRCPASTGACVQGCACKAGYVREKPNTACVLESQCTCKTGFEHGANGCNDIDECADAGLNDCDANTSSCVNINGGFVCACIAGYAHHTGSTVCQDVNECLGDNRCGPHGDCANTDGDYDCNCHAGYELDTFGHTCGDIDECQTPGACPASSSCTNTDGGHVCKCDSGFVMNQATTTCDDVDECSNFVHTCNGNADCVNTDGAYDCDCKEGYELRPTRSGDLKCRNANECQDGTDTCSTNSMCRDTIGSYTCVCKTGFAMLNNVCVDVNECAINAHSQSLKLEILTK